MKKSLLVLLILLLVIVGCNKKEEKEENKENIEEPIVEPEPVLEPEPEPPKEPEYVDLNNTPISIYRNNKKVTEFQGNIVVGKDVAMFKIYPSNDEYLELNDSFGKAFNNKWKEYNTSGTLKMGFNLTYDVADGRHFSQTIRHVTDNYKYEGYILIFLYDDYDLTVNNKIYKHVDIEEETEDTMFSSINLYGEAASDEIISKVYLTAFTYDTEDDFDENGEYRGNSKYTITICVPNKTC